VTSNNRSENCLENFRAKSDEISSMAIYTRRAYKIVRTKVFDKWWNSYNCEQLAP